MDLTLEFYRRNYIEGLFLSSGIIQSPDYTMEQLVEVARPLREDHAFGGYIHLKTDSRGEPRSCRGRGPVRRPCQREHRAADAATISQRWRPEKTDDIDRSDDGGRDRVRLEERRRWRDDPWGAAFAPAGQTHADDRRRDGSTRCGDSGDGIAALRSARACAVSTTRRSARFRRHRRGCRPIAAARMREHRLYQADWLIRFYGNSTPQSSPPSSSRISRRSQPKLAWALRHPEAFPVDVNAAPRERLLRIPGVGYRTVDRLLRIRRHHQVTIGDLLKLRVRMSEARHFVVTADSRPAPVPSQLFARAQQQVLQW